MPYSCSRRTLEVFPRWSCCARLWAATIALADRYQYPCPAELGVLRNPVSSKCGQQCGINSCQSDLLLWPAWRKQGLVAVPLVRLRGGLGEFRSPAWKSHKDSPRTAVGYSSEKLLLPYAKDSHRNHVESHVESHIESHVHWGGKLWLVPGKLKIKLIGRRGMCLISHVRVDQLI